MATDGPHTGDQVRPPAEEDGKDEDREEQTMSEESLVGRLPRLPPLRSGIIIFISVLFKMKLDGS